ncbi:inositol monophosphatase family protein [Sphingobium sp. CR28]|uniref:inositol monophosphatase family protein n=1 Tax=Sphingobium sp. CR28 TaxID=3400272 RepID=UPI003FEF01E2
MPAIDLSILHATLSAADHAATWAMESWVCGAPATNHWEKTPGQPVCDADIGVDRILRERLGAVLPGAGWLSEESASSAGRANARHVWVVDPIDGTRDYVRGRPGWAVSIALVEDGAPVLAALVAPARGERWWAATGQGAWRNGKRLRASTRKTLAGARVPADALAMIDRDLVMVSKPNSIALRMAMVAADEADLLASVRWGAEWDIAAAAIIASEAGATVTDALGRPLRFNRENPVALGVLCSAPEIHATAVQRLRERAKAVMRLQDDPGA